MPLQATPRKPTDRWNWLLYLFLALALVLILLQTWGAIATHGIVSRAEQQASAPKDEIERENARQEMIGRRIDNDTKGLVQTVLATQIGALAAILVTLSGAIIAVRGYLDARRKERLDRLGTALSETLARLVSSDARQRIVGAAGLLPFFDPDNDDYHLQALAALVAAARFNEEQADVRQSIRLVVERAARTVSPELLRRVSWQGVKLSSVNLDGCDLREIDLRDAVLENAALSGTRLDGSNLTAARLQGAKMAKATLTGADITYADLAGASLAGAVLAGARFGGIKVLNLDLEGTDFTAVGSDWRTVPWDATRNWRAARFDADVRATLDARYGTQAPAVRVLMLLWEIPPFVAGGTWTAAYHLVRDLRRRGADVTIVVPWAREAIQTNAFGVEVPIVALGIAPPENTASPYGAASQSWSPYGSSWSPYGSSWSPYGSSWSPYARAATPYEAGWSPYGGPSLHAPGAGPYSPRGDALGGSVLLRLIAEFRRKLETYVADHPADVIHAHDWVTFDAARAAAERGRIPWIAHFHSVAADRQPDGSDPLTERIEQSAVDVADRIVTPSAVTRRQLIDCYHANEQRIDVIPNVFSESDTPAVEMGRFETKRVIFLGRLSRQKGVDRFCAVADLVHRTDPTISFEVYGDGEERPLLSPSGVSFRGPLDWNERGRAFREASVLLVPSRFEPFGMVILEGMQHRVPVVYPSHSGAAEVLSTGVKVDADDVNVMASEILSLLGKLDMWAATVRLEADEIDAYPHRGYDDNLLAVWREAQAGKARDNVAPGVVSPSRP